MIVFRAFTVFLLLVIAGALFVLLYRQGEVVPVEKKRIEENRAVNPEESQTEEAASRSTKNEEEGSIAKELLELGSSSGLLGKEDGEVKEASSEKIVEKPSPIETKDPEIQVQEQSGAESLPAIAKQYSPRPFKEITRAEIREIFRKREEADRLLNSSYRGGR